MNREFWTWLVMSDQGLAVRISAGVVIFALLAWWDVRRKGPEAKRWREYVFLLATVAASMVYAGLSDQISSAVSWEYFYYHDPGIAAAMGSHLPPAAATVHWEAMKLGLRAGWTPGLLVGVILLLANNPSRTRPQLTYATLARQAVVIAAGAAALSILAGVAGCLGAFDRLLDEPMIGAALRLHNFMSAYGMHVGAYVGGTAGMVVAVWRVWKLRRCHPQASENCG